MPFRRHLARAASELPAWFRRPVGGAPVPEPDTILGRRDVALVPWVSLFVLSLAIAVSAILRGPNGAVDQVVVGIALGGAVVTALLALSTDLLIGVKLREEVWAYVLGSGILFIALAVMAYRTDGVATPYFLVVVPLSAYIGLVFPASWRNVALVGMLVGTLAVQLTAPGTGWYTALTVEVLIVAGWLVGVVSSLGHARAARIAADVSSFDGLTTTLNRRGFLEQVELHVSPRAQDSGPLALLMIDLDRFKAVNDRDGHAAGDALLAWVGTALQGVLPERAQLGRLGGDEFAALLPGTDEADAVAVALGVRSVLSERIGASVGVATSPTSNVDVDELFRVGDDALYTSKRSSQPAGIHAFPVPRSPAPEPKRRRRGGQRAAGRRFGDGRGPLDYATLRDGGRPNMPDPGIVYGWMMSRGISIVAACGVIVVVGAFRVPALTGYDELLRVLGIPCVLWFCLLAWLAHGRDHLEGGRYALVVYGSGIALGFALSMAMLANGGIIAVVSAALYLRVLFEAAIMPQRRAVIGLATMVFFWAVAVVLGPPAVLWAVPFQLVLFAASFALGAIAHRAFDDVTEHTRSLARTDSLTGVRNRLGFETSAKDALRTAKTTDGAFGILALDLDDFKRINDTQGHATGDAVLRRVSTVLTETFPDSPTVGRLGGDEFVVVVEARMGDDAAFHIRRLTSALEPVVGASIGHAVFPFDGSDLESLLLVADQRSYEMKRRKPPRPMRIVS